MADRQEEVKHVSSEEGQLASGAVSPGDPVPPPSAVWQSCWAAPRSGVSPLAAGPMVLGKNKIFAVAW